ncbi:piggyBac transposable element-derived protein 4-like [Coccinella septempunctata]|uniref:piggyBac transposable element-derived protein 4-like n=1 Tax=Coccinella septempunctata TaxID=41139 RepID=UPI001D05CB52|nr:piggyBac transposable element-derived protein 4-like [Coccinella septempunctata]
MESKNPEQWLKWYEEIMNGESANENAEVNEIYAEEDNDSEIDQLQESDHGSDTEQEDDPSTEEIIEGPTFLGKDKKTVWSKMPPPSTRTKRHNLVLRIPGPQGFAKTAKTHLECFSIFIDDEMINLIVACTNIKIEDVKNKFERDRDARSTDSCEIKALIGILYIAGVQKSGRENILDLWSTDGTGCEQIYLTMSYNRFRFLCRCIRFDNIHDRHERRQFDKLAPIRNIFERFVDHCKYVFVPSPYLTIDEQLIAFRGRCSFRMYMPAKPAKYGLKLFALVDTKTMFTLNLEIYPGVQPDGPYLQSNSAYDVVKRMTEPVRNTNRNITMDRWFTSVPLVLDLLKDKLTVIGSINSNKREIPM